MRILGLHLYPDHLNIYADRGNIAVLERRAAWRGHELDVRAAGPGGALRPGAGGPVHGRGGGDGHGGSLPGAALFPQETVAGELRMIGDVLLECELEPGERRALAGF